LASSRMKQKSCELLRKSLKSFEKVTDKSSDELG